MNHAHWGLSLRFPTLSGSPALSLPCLPRLRRGWGGGGLWHEAMVLVDGGRGIWLAQTRFP